MSQLRERLERLPLQNYRLSPDRVSRSSSAIARSIASMVLRDTHTPRVLRPVFYHVISRLAPRQGNQAAAPHSKIELLLGRGARRPDHRNAMTAGWVPGSLYWPGEASRRTQAGPCHKLLTICVITDAKCRWASNRPGRGRATSPDVLDAGGCTHGQVDWLRTDVNVRASGRP